LRGPANKIEGCRREEIAAYLDGELNRDDLSLFEEHLSECPECARELQEQRRLLCALDFALGGDDPSIALPRNFAKVVAVHAESDMSGVRHPKERRRALWLCTGLALIAFALLGGSSLNTSLFVPLRIAVRYLTSVTGIISNALYDAGVGLAVILRAVGRHFIFESHPFGLLAFLLFAIALALLPRLIVRYHRA
jgi:predicted anti-sigma-YlaC factor YlaD